ncbi:MAG TPA: tetratricopeptide repeat protein [Kofleriaceae bacterium]|nr:tetratricopeptide repeat protein [Kofleriaceae bacterium]
MWLRGAIVTIGCSLAVAAAADPPAAPAQREADQLFQQGRADLNTRHDPAAACKKFERAIALDPTAPGTMLNLGLCNEELGKFKSALYWYRKAQARASETHLQPEYEQAAKDHTTRLAGEVATIQIEITGASDARVKIDDEEINPADFGRVEVDPGPHTLVAGATGKKIVRQPFMIVGKGGQTVRIALVDGDNTIVIDRGRPRRHLAVFVAAGGGGLMLASALLAWDEKAVYDHYAGPAAMGDASALHKTQDAKSIARYWGTGLFVAGVATAGAAALIYLTAPQKERVDQTVFVPTIGPDQIGFAASGSF